MLRRHGVWFSAMFQVLHLSRPRCNMESYKNRTSCLPDPICTLSMCNSVHELNHVNHILPKQNPKSKIRLIARMKMVGSLLQKHLGEMAVLYCTTSVQGNLQTYVEAAWTLFLFLSNQLMGLELLQCRCKELLFDTFIESIFRGLGAQLQERFLEIVHWSHQHA